MNVEVEMAICLDTGSTPVISIAEGRLRKSICFSQPFYLLILLR